MSAINNLIGVKTIHTLKRWHPFTKYCFKYHTISGVYGYKPKPNHIIEEKSALKNKCEVSADITQLVNAFRSRGHLLSQLDPLRLTLPESSDALEIDVNYYATNHSLIDPKTVMNIDRNECKVNEMVKTLMQIYCGNISIEFMHLTDANERIWIANKWENIISNTSFTSDDKKHLASDLLKSELFEQFLTKKFSSVKRYGGEGSETMITLFEHIFKTSVEHKISDIIIGMPHRGRLILMANSLDFPPVLFFRKMLGESEFDLSKANGATGDILTHLFTSIDRQFGHKSVHISLLPNPSHLEVISPVVCGKTRAKAMTKSVGPYSESNSISPILGIQVHGDAAFNGQGVVMETLAMSRVPHFSTDGSIHLIVNNQIGYTTPGKAFQGRSSRYCSDLIKAIDCPSIHVNGEDPESVVKAAQFALEYRQKFGKDIAIDLICYRQWGHNELDDPTFTNPIMYSNIKYRETIPQNYANQVLSGDEKERIINEYSFFLNKHFQEVDKHKPNNTNFKGVWSEITQASNDRITRWDTSVEPNLLGYICQKSTESPENFNLHQNLKKVMNERLNRVKEGLRIDWATAEALTFGSLLYQGYNVRISGQDVGRGDPLN